MISGAKKFGVRLLVGVLVLAMAAFGLENLFLGNTQAAIEINGEQIQQARLDGAVRQYRLSLANTYGQDIVDAIGEEFVAQNAQNQLVQQVLLAQQVEKLSLGVDDKVVNTYIRSLPSFQGDDGFSIDVVNSFLISNRMSLVELQNNIRSDIAKRLILDSLTGSSVIHTARLNGLANVLFHNRGLLYATVLPSDIAQHITPTDSDIAKYYADNSADFIDPEQASFQYIHMQLSDFIDDSFLPSQQDIEFVYQNYIAERTDEGTYELAHILITTDEQSEQEALAQANDIARRLSQGEDFAELATLYSRDIGSADNGGSLGQVTLDTLVPEFADQVRLMQPGEISPPVQSDFGYHIIRLDSTPQSAAPTLEDRRDAIITQLRKDRATDAYAKGIDQLTNLLQDADGLDAAAQTLSLSIGTTPLINKQGATTQTDAIRDNNQQFLFSPQVLQAAFSDEVLVQDAISDLVILHPLDSEQDAEAVVLYKNAYIPAQQLPIEDVRSQVVLLVKDTMATQIAEQITNAMLDLQPHIALQEQTADIISWLQGSLWRDALPSTIRDYVQFIQWTYTQDFTRYSTEPDGLASSVFRYAPLLHVLRLSQDKTHVYIEVSSELPMYADLDSMQRQRLFDTLLTDTGESISSSYMAYLQNIADIRYN